MRNVMNEELRKVLGISIAYGGDGDAAADAAAEADEDAAQADGVVDNAVGALDEIDAAVTADPDIPIDNNPVDVMADLTLANVTVSNFSNTVTVTGGLPGNNFGSLNNNGGFITVSNDGTVVAVTGTPQGSQTVTGTPDNFTATDGASVSVADITNTGIGTATFTASGGASINVTTDTNGNVSITISNPA